jgi:flagellar biosynthesis protein FliQ
MSTQFALDLAYKALFTAAKISAPVLISAIVTGIVVNIFQTITSIKDMSLTFVPKMLVAGVVMALALPWVLGVMNAFFEEMYLLFGV